MIRRKISLLLAILMVITTMTVGFTPVTAGSDDGITTDISAPADEYNDGGCYEKDNKAYLHDSFRAVSLLMCKR